ncbi:DUF72 domain-containing protein [Beijerinckia sp. L45]|uniref:DUF72 domain-containing protein n=1 Tax=Beijerinckia sp. L45 TaxID=1641855 RepID=UPI0034CF059F
MALYIGTAGWTIPSRYGGAFAMDGTHLERYAQKLDAVEINSSFYRAHKPATYERWAASVPASFRFAVKMPKAISHEHKLVGCDALVARFGEELAGLGDKLGVVLVQLPPSFAHDAALTETFFIELRRHIKAPVALEPRHGSWLTPEVEARLKALQVARVAADPAVVPGADAPGGWDGLVYRRLHGSPRIYYSNYEPAVLDATRDALAADAARGVPTWCIFDNTAAFAALGNALTVLGR